MFENLWDNITGRTKVGAVKKQYNSAINSSVNAWDKSIGSAEGSFSGVDQLSEMLKGMGTTDLTDKYRESLRSDIADILSGNINKVSDTIASGGVSAGLGVSAMRTVAKDAYSTIGKNLTNFTISDAERRQNALVQAGNLQQSKAQTLSSLYGARAGSLADLYMNKADAMSTVRMSNAANQSNFFSGLISAGGQIGAAMLGAPPIPMG